MLLGYMSSHDLIYSAPRRKRHASIMERSMHTGTCNSQQMKELTLSKRQKWRQALKQVI